MHMADVLPLTTWKGQIQDAWLPELGQQTALLQIFAGLCHADKITGELHML